MRNSRALQLVERLNKSLWEMHDGEAKVTYAFKGIKAGDYAPSTASVKNTEDQLRAKQLVAGHDYHWESPFRLSIKQNMIDRDLLDVIQTDGGEEEREG